MEKTDKKTLEEIIRVDHAGERGAIKIYEGQLLALKTIKQNSSLKETIEEMREHEKEHLEYFEKEIKKRKIKPTHFLPLWDVMGVALGFGSVLLGKKATMLCTASVEEVIENHYQDQIKKLGNDEEELKNKIEKFKKDEIDHKNIAYEAGANSKGIYSIMNKVIQTGSRIAIAVSEKI
jgi:3-demethoxyubiquinol 3-hydroxylase|tara:strand:- start:402 stop:935 length:534 start_codon:yes stop_codon:yes gene_type:complete